MAQSMNMRQQWRMVLYGSSFERVFINVCSKAEASIELALAALTVIRASLLSFLLSKVFGDFRLGATGVRRISAQSGGDGYISNESCSKAETKTELALAALILIRASLVLFEQFFGNFRSGSAGSVGITARDGERESRDGGGREERRDGGGAANVRAFYTLGGRGGVVCAPMLHSAPMMTRWRNNGIAEWRAPSSGWRARRAALLRPRGQGDAGRGEGPRTTIAATRRQCTETRWCLLVASASSYPSCVAFWETGESNATTAWAMGNTCLHQEHDPSAYLVPSLNTFSGEFVDADGCTPKIIYLLIFVSGVLCERIRSGICAG
ncbi:hypothetical protein EDD18DRAFT_1333331 [Armillaria luteobubalina]|uniref:Uncharacterized protein n=1 Tax=Armillaria luteobubalina TaxID=153913 RepID=A0AA39Q239_9AGAR|nr:hypothetical protein EDD18DRAFT_1333331 [Armillaria luteobubalina]